MNVSELSGLKKVKNGRKRSWTGTLHERNYERFVLDAGDLLRGLIGLTNVSRG